MEMSISLPTVADFRAAQHVVNRYAIRTPLVRLKGAGENAIYLKLENLQPIGSFKIRGAANALIRRCNAGVKAVWTASAGNFAQGLAYAAKDVGIPITTLVPDTAARSKIEALRAFGAEIVERPYRDWWALLESTGVGTSDPEFIHPVADCDVMAGNGTIGLEIAEDLPEVTRVFVPYGGGGLSVGIAGAIHGANSGTQVVACETEAGTPVAAAFAAGRPVRVPFNPETFITGMGSAEVLEAMWPLVSQELSGAVRVTLEQVADAIRRLAHHHHVIAEGAGAAPVACALRETSEGGPSVCIVSGGHLDTQHLLQILAGGTPGRANEAMSPQSSPRETAS